MPTDPPWRVKIADGARKRILIMICAQQQRDRRRCADQLRAALFRVADGLTHEYTRGAVMCYSVRAGAHAQLWQWVHETCDADAITWTADTPEWREQRHAHERAAFERERAEWHRTHKADQSGARHTTGQPTRVQAAYASFHLLPTAPLWVAEAVYRAAATRYHPDKPTGDADRMRSANAAIAAIRDAAPK